MSAGSGTRRNLALLLAGVVLLSALLLWRCDSVVRWRAERFCESVARAIVERQSENGSLPPPHEMERLLRDAPSLPREDKWSARPSFGVRPIDERRFEVWVRFPYERNCYRTLTLAVPEWEWRNTGYIGPG